MLELSGTDVLQNLALNGEGPVFPEKKKAFSGNHMDEEMSRQTAAALPTGTSKCAPSQRVPGAVGHHGPPTATWPACSSAPCASTMCCPLSCSARAATWCAATAGPSSPACPTCRGPLGSIRNLAMEKVANSVLFPCKYGLVGLRGDAAAHREGGARGAVRVPAVLLPPAPGASCKWQGSLERRHAPPHAPAQVHHHAAGRGHIVFLATDINLPGAVDWVMMQSCFGFHFMLVLEKQEKYDGHQQFLRHRAAHRHNTQAG
ncbi:hypothetical protein SKAU_G00114460 [Synaphobranchus kaupii]|uniref:RING-type E3 ubiquitin transferase n=1 Tax=Synaphobranchus kaupii TaxID=118154 RepID=A0A9Q1J8S2_SYNKA|nr:hypothetical protein SKAU_G00114460 [Synaphobranchus kaupii]